MDNQLQNPRPSLMKAALEYGVIFSLIGMALFAISHYAGVDLNGAASKIGNWVISIAMVVWMLWHFREKKNSGVLGFGQGVKLSVLTGVVSGIVGAVLMYFFVTMIAPEFMENVENQAIEGMQAQGLSDEQIAQNMKIASMFMSPVAMAFYAFFGSVVSYLILGLVFSAILKRGN